MRLLLRNVVDKRMLKTDIWDKLQALNIRVQYVIQYKPLRRDLDFEKSDSQHIEIAFNHRDMWALSKNKCLCCNGL
jgi:hypothetical protein